MYGSQKYSCHLLTYPSHQQLYVVRNDRFVYVIRVFQLPKHRDVVLDTIIAEKAFARLSEVTDFNLFSHVSSGLWVQVSPAYQEYSDEYVVWAVLDASC